MAYSYAGYQALNPGKPLPGDEVDVSFAAVQKQIEDLAERLAEVRRDDGRLVNGLVTLDALGTDALRALGGPPSTPGEFDGISFFDLSQDIIASANEAATVVAADKLMTPLGTGRAIGKQRPFATRSEAEEGSQNDVVMTPVRTVEALDWFRGFATETEAREADNATRVLNPPRGRDLVDEIRRVASVSIALAWGQIVSQGSVAQSFPVSGARIGDKVVWSLPAAGIAPGLIVQGWVSAADTVTLRITNITAATTTPFSGEPTTLGVTALGF